MSEYKKALKPTEIAAVEDSAINFGNIPELDDSFWREAKVLRPDRTEQPSVRKKRSVHKRFRVSGRG